MKHEYRSSKPETHPKHEIQMTEMLAPVGGRVLNSGHLNIGACFGLGICDIRILPTCLFRICSDSMLLAQSAKCQGSGDSVPGLWLFVSVFTFLAARQSDTNCRNPSRHQNPKPDPFFSTLLLYYLLGSIRPRPKQANACFVESLGRLAL